MSELSENWRKTQY